MHAVHYTNSQDELTAKISCSDNGDLDLNPFPAAGAQTISLY